MLARRSYQTTFSLPPDADEPDPKYRAALEWVWSFSAQLRTPAEMAAQRAVKLDRMRSLLANLGHPERALAGRSVLVAGTKGKGSTVAMIGACLQAARLRTARYTSPHLVNWRERTCIDGQPIGVDAVLGLIDPVRRAVEGLDPGFGAPTTFEVGTALSLLYFMGQAIDVAVVEVGTGGRYDATNLIEPAVSVITPISYDHTSTLGDTLTSIGWHKAGILRGGKPGVLAPQVDEARRIVEAEASTVGAPLEEVGREWTWRPLDDRTRVESTHAEFAPLETHVGLLGDHQRDNATTAVAALYALGIVAPRLKTAPAAMMSGLADVDWPGRLQVLSEAPLVVVDGAHNAASAEVLRAAVDKELRWRRLFLILGLSTDKDVRGVIEALAVGAHTVHLTRSRHERSADPALLEPLVRSVAPEARVTVQADLTRAIEAARAEAGADDLILVSGSLFLVGEMLVWWRRSSR